MDPRLLPLATHPYEGSADQVRDLLESVRLRLLRYESILSELQERTGASRAVAPRLAFLFENAEPHRVPAEEGFIEALDSARGFVQRRVAATPNAATRLRWEQLRRRFALTWTEELLLLTCLAPSFSSGFRDAIMAAQGLREPGLVGAAFLADLLAFDDAERWAILDLLQPDATLLRAGLLIPQSADAAPALSRLIVSPVLVDHVMDRDVHAAVANTLRRFCALEAADLPLASVPLTPEQAAAAARFFAVVEAGEAGVVHSTGFDPLTLVRALAHERSAHLLRLHQLDLQGQASPGHPYYQAALLARLFALPVVIDLRHLDETPPALCHQVERLMRVAEASPRVVLLRNHPEPMEVLPGAAFFSLTRTSVTQRAWMWTRALAPYPCADDLDLAYLAQALNIPEHLVEACARAARAASLSADPEGRLRQPVLLEQARRKQSQGFEAVADKVTTDHTLDDLIIDPRCAAELQAVLDFIEHRHDIKARFPNFARRRRLGTLVLLYGPPGTGKTLAASVIARVCNRELFQISLSRVVDKYIGETEKQLERVFTIAEGTDAVILFDEADALFARRTRARSSNDQYSNMRTNYLLQRVESYSGVCVLTTNNLEAIDEAFRRRIPFQIPFARPDSTSRARLWRHYLSRAGLADLAADLADELAEDYDFSGAHIHNAVTKAIIQSLSQHTPISPDTLISAAEREYAAMGGLVRVDADDR